VIGRSGATGRTHVATVASPGGRARRVIGRSEATGRAHVVDGGELTPSSRWAKGKSKASVMARLSLCTAWIAALASVAPVANADPSTPAVVPVVAPQEHVARFALVLNEPRAVLDECGGVAVLKEAVERRLEREAFTDEAAADASLVISIDPLPEGRWQAHIGELDRTGTEVGHRDVVIDADACQKGVDTLAVILAIMIGPPRMIASPAPGAPLLLPTDQTEQHAALPTDRTEQHAARPHPPAAVPPAKRPAVPARPRWSIAPVAAMVAGSGILPGVSWGVEGGLALYPPTERLSFLARAQLWPPRSAGTQPEVHLDRFSVALLACHRAARLSGATFTLCAGLDGGWLNASAPSIRGQSKGVSRLLLDVPFEARLGFDLSPPHRSIRLEPVLAAQLAVLISRDRFTFQNRMDQEVTLHRAAPVALSGTIGLAVHFF
jgi:hypothetical protein